MRDPFSGDGTEHHPGSEPVIHSNGRRRLFLHMAALLIIIPTIAMACVPSQQAKGTIRVAVTTSAPQCTLSITTRNSGNPGDSCIPSATPNPIVATVGSSITVTCMGTDSAMDPCFSDITINSAAMTECNVLGNMGTCATTPCTTQLICGSDLKFRKASDGVTVVNTIECDTQANAGAPLPSGLPLAASSTRADWSTSENRPISSRRRCR